jgi:single-strand DNA-binding protein
VIDALVSGKLIRDPQLKTGASNKPFCNFLLSVPVGDNEPCVVSCIAFGDVAEHIAKLQKGDAVAVTGSLSPSQWIDKTTGETRRGLNCTVSAALSPYDIRKRRAIVKGRRLSL